ncbi:MAG: nuclear transport factor 2 family protein [Calditrichia bacterium]
MSTLLNELLAVEKACAAAFNRRDVDSILEHFSDDISGFSSTKHERFHGKEELKSTFEYYLSEAEDLTFEIADPEVIDLGELAILTLYWKVILKSGNKIREVNGRGSHVFRRFNGTWKIIHEHFSKAH